jgi:hypothetical protein
MRSTRIAAALLLVFAAAGDARAQTVIAPTERLAFDSPESWALQYYTSTTFLEPFDPTGPERAGAIGVQLEAGWLPALAPAQEQVGFAGTAAEDLNKAPIFVRPRVRVAVSPRVALTVAGVPPAHAFGVTPRLLALGAEWAFVDRDSWRLTVRAHGQTGTVTGAFTCPAGVLPFPPGSAANPTGCNAVSTDAATLRYGAVEFGVARRLASGAVVPHVAFAANAIDARFQVDARAFGRLDRTRLDTSGVTWSTTVGATLRLGDRADATADLLYTPLWVRRGGPGATVDGLLTARATITYWIRR